MVEIGVHTSFAKFHISNEPGNPNPPLTAGRGRLRRPSEQTPHHHHNLHTHHHHRLTHLTHHTHTWVEVVEEVVGEVGECAATVAVVMGL